MTSPGKNAELVVRWVRVRRPHLPAARAMSPLDYASIWIEETEKSATPESRWKMLNEWMNAYQQMQLKGVSFGLFTLRKRTNRANFVSFDDAPAASSPAGAHVAEMLACRDYLAALDATGNADDVLANANLWFSPHLRVDQHLRPASNSPGSSWKHERDDIRLAHGYGFPKVIDHAHMDVLMALDGSRSVSSKSSRPSPPRPSASQRPPAAHHPPLPRLALVRVRPPAGLPCGQ